MVLEHLFPEDWLERKPRYAFILGVVYSIVGILVARLLFPSDPALVAVAFISILLLPELRKIFAIEERQERHDKRVSLKRLWRDDHDVIAVYLCLFLGIFIVYALATVWLPSFSVNALFRQQLAYRGAALGNAAGTGVFWSILSNNILVLLGVFLFGLLAGDGAIFLIAWNASVWGTLFAASARSASSVLGGAPIWLLGLVLLIVLPHMLLEATSYIMAAISGSLISKGVEKETGKVQSKVLNYNLVLLGLSLVVLLVGVLVETWVLGHVTLYQRIIQAGLH